MGFFHFARRYFGNHSCFLFLRLLRCFSSPRSPLQPMYSAADVSTLPETGCPIQKSPDQSLFSNSPKLIAAYHVFHRLLTPRHPPIALNSLATTYYNPILNVFMYSYPNCQRAKMNNGGGERVRTDDLLRARQALSQLSYTPDPDTRLWFLASSLCNGGPGWN